MAKTAPKRGSAAPRIEPFPEPLTRLASLRMSLRLVEPTGSGPAGDEAANDRALATAWAKAEDAQRECFDRRSGQLVASASEGVEALMASLAMGRAPNEEASRELADQIRRELKEISGIVLG
jgi:hypothetical protein